MGAKLSVYRYMGFCSYKFCKRSIFEGWVIYISHKLGTLVYENMFLSKSSFGLWAKCNCFCQNNIWALQIGAKIILDFYE